MQCSGCPAVGGAVGGVEEGVGAEGQGSVLHIHPGLLEHIYRLQLQQHISIIITIIDTGNNDRKVSSLH